MVSKRLELVLSPTVLNLNVLVELDRSEDIQPHCVDSQEKRCVQKPR